MSLNSDFTGTYCWPSEEARLEAAYFREIFEECDKTELEEQKSRIRSHWARVFDDPQDLATFCRVFNSCIGSDELFI